MQLINGNALDALKDLPTASVQTIVTSPPYYALRDYGVNGQIGQENSPKEYIDTLVSVFHEAKRVLKDDGTLWVNIGDTYCGTGDKGNLRDPKYVDGRNGQVKAKNRDCQGLKHKDLIGIPWMLAFALREDGWYLRQDIIWSKSNAMPESVKDRCVKSHEYIFLLSKQSKYYFDYSALRETAKTPPVVRNKHDEGYQADYSGGDRFSPCARVYGADGKRTKRDVWDVPTQPFKEAHFAVFPCKLIEPCILAGSWEGDTVLDMFMGSGTTGIVAKQHNRDFIGIDLNPKYCEMAQKRLDKIYVQTAIDI